MLEAARVLGSFAAVLLIVAVAAWVRVLRGPELQRLSGRRAGRVGNVEIASQLLVLTAGLSGVAAVLAVAGLLFT